MTLETPIQTTPAEAPVEAPSMDDTLRETWAKLQEEPAEIETKPRGEDGKFQPKEVEAKEEPVSHETPGAVTQKDEAPTSWRKEMREKWATIPDDLRAEILRREDASIKGVSAQKTHADLGRNIERVLAPYADNFQKLGISPDFAIKQLFDLENSMRNGSPQQKASILQRLATDYGVDLTKIGVPQDPALAQALQKVSNYEAFIQHQRYLNEKNAAEQESEASQQITKVLGDFAEGKEHFESVRVAMGALLQTGQAKDLQDAYDQACWANPDIRAATLATQAKEAQAKAREIAEAAKRRSAANVTPRGTLPVNKAVGSMDDTLREEAQRLGFIS